MLLKDVLFTFKWKKYKRSVRSFLFACELNSVKIKSENANISEFCFRMIAVTQFLQFFLKRNSSFSWFLLMYCTELVKFFDSKALSNLLSSWIRYLNCFYKNSFQNKKIILLLLMKIWSKRFFFLVIAVFKIFFACFLWKGLCPSRFYDFHKICNNKTFNSVHFFRYLFIIAMISHRDFFWGLFLIFLICLGFIIFFWFLFYFWQLIRSFER